MDAAWEFQAVKAMAMDYERPIDPFAAQFLQI
jgi:hypothetical protein